MTLDDLYHAIAHVGEVIEALREQPCEPQRAIDLMTLQRLADDLAIAFHARFVSCALVALDEE